MKAAHGVVVLGVPEHRLDRLRACSVEPLAEFGCEHFAHPLVVAALPAAPGALSLAGVGRYSGARPQDALALSYARTGTKRIVDAEKNVDGHIVPGSKTGENRARSVTLLAPLRRDRLAFRLAAGNPPDEALVLPQTEGRPWRLHDYKNWQRPAVKTERSRGAASLFAAAATNIGRPNATPYFLRHAYASLRLAEQRLSLQEIAEEMGHTVEILARTYAHVILEYHGRGPIAPDALMTSARRRETPQNAQAPPPTAGTPQADGGTRTPDPIITSASHVSLVGVSGDQFAVNSGDSGSSGDCAGQAKRPKNAPRRLGVPRAVTAFLGSLRRSGRRFASAVASDPRTDGV